MNDILADTHTVIWYLFEPAKLSAAATKALADAEVAGAKVLVSAISLVEVRYLIEKAKLPATVENDIGTALDDPAEPLELVPLNREVATALAAIPRNLVPDMPDRIIAATALALKLPLVTCDPKIQQAPITTIW
jgi:PIN domain nuclease of toxin-antitoxin system